MYVIGTAGHVDHGKSTLVEALTGIDPDRLDEEKAREMTIDLGFAWLDLGDGDETGVVDVPGHRDFIENMLAGVGGIDLALFVVAADEGVMPQTKEHLAILDLLDVPGGVVALTKVDLVDDPEWLELVALDLSEALVGTALADAPIVAVSAKTGFGLAALKGTLLDRLTAVPPREDKGQPRLPVDRVFSLSGFGTVVTGTLLDGRFHTGDAVQVQPSGLNGRIRGLQTHRTKRDVALPGSRVAVNLTGISKDEIKRGDVLTLPGRVGSTILFDATYRHLADADAPLKHNMEVKLFVGAAEVVARTRVLGAPQIEPGQTGWLQLATRDPVAVVRGDRFILRRPSPGATLGGGRVLDPFPGRRHRRFRPEIVQRLQTLAQGTPGELLLQTLSRLEPEKAAALIKQSNLDEALAQAALQELIAQGQVVEVGTQLMSHSGWQKTLDKLVTVLMEYHGERPLRLGMSREEVRSRLKLPAAVFNPLISQAVSDHLLADDGTLLRLPTHEVTFTAQQQKAIEQLMGQLARAGFQSPSVKECKTAVGEDVYYALVDLGQLQQLNNEVVYTPQLYNQIVQQITGYLRQNGTINAAQTRDLFNTSRKYAIGLLEHLDDIKITRRVGDNRELINKQSG
ncbi:MAG: selenocysteine-specific translation elongation factor [Ardenticatenaceae bacterium]|nr:selenocysteine-specific translation elongation factor [Ardenticatenaceae bacterium]